MLSFPAKQRLCLPCRINRNVHARTPDTLSVWHPSNLRSSSSSASANKPADASSAAHTRPHGPETTPLPSKRGNKGQSRRKGLKSRSGKNALSTAARNGDVRFSPGWKQLLANINQFRPILKSCASSLVQEGADASTFQNVTIDEVLKAVELKGQLDKAFLETTSQLRNGYAGRLFAEVDADLGRIANVRPKPKALMAEESTKKALTTMGLVHAESSGPKSAPDQNSTTPTVKPRRVRNRSSQKNLTSTKDKDNTASEAGPSRTKALDRERLSTLDQQLVQEVSLKDFALVPLPIERSTVPTLGHDLSRVLFNPGVYQLQDPRSRVWNFDPYLGNIMPVSEFNYDALNKYITSSADSHLRDVALKHEQRYIGSTSSMSGVLSHFHFLLSAWRELTLNNLSRGFGDDGRQFTKIQRGPTAIFLRYKAGVYAVDADKEYDSANILMSLGRSMEKLLTNEKDEFERYRRTHDAQKDSQVQSTEPEAYHYSKLGQFLIRSQLDAYDPRLPGTGMFDLKTRAVAAVRMMVREHATGAGYQIKERFGTWESFEREYYDMMRSAFLKYSLQVRMGRMDGIFVAYHNTERLFGFQYIPLTEMDLALHGQSNRTLGDREFRLSVGLLSDIFDQATAQFPKQSLRFHFETREATSVQAPHMYIFAEPVSNEEIADIQTAKQAEIEAYEQRIFNPHRTHSPQKAKEAEDELEEQSDGRDEDATINVSPSHQSNAADVKSTVGGDLTPEQKAAASPEKPLLGWKLNISNIVNGSPVSRPQDLKETDTWSIRYTLTPFAEGPRQRNYTLCKNRRKTVLQAPQEQDDSVRYFMRRLVNLSRAGAEWRRRLDELDAQRDRVVLYGDRDSSRHEK